MGANWLCLLLPAIITLIIFKHVLSLFDLVTFSNSLVHANNNRLNFFRLQGAFIKK